MSTVRYEISHVFAGEYAAWNLQSISVADLQSALARSRLTSKNFLNFMQFFWKIWKACMLAPPGGSAPLLWGILDLPCLRYWIACISPSFLFHVRLLCQVGVYSLSVPTQTKIQYSQDETLHYLPVDRCFSTISAFDSLPRES